MKFSEYQSQAAKHILVYGPPKSGKTALVGKLAKDYKLWWFDLEDGIKTLKNPAVFDPAWSDNIELFSIPDMQTFPIAIETMLKVLKGGPCKVCHEHGKVGCAQCIPKGANMYTEIDVRKLDVNKDILVIESYSQLAESTMNYIMKDQIAKDNWDAKPGWDEWGKQGRLLERIGSTIQVAPFNIIVTTHEQMVEMEDGSKKIVPIGGTSNASKVFAKYFDEVVYTELLNKRHNCISSTTAKANVLAGSRSGVDLKAGDTLLQLFVPANTRTNEGAK